MLRCSDCGAGKRAFSEREPDLCVFCAGDVRDPRLPQEPANKFRVIKGAYTDVAGHLAAKASPGQGGG